MAEICQSLDEVEKKLDTEQWLVLMTNKERQLFNHLKRVERDWINACGGAGCDVLRLDRPESTNSTRLKRGHFIVLVPPAVMLPESDRVVAAIDMWRDALAELVQAQGKNDHIGIRSASYPVWIGADGKTDLPLDAMPDYRADRVLKTYYRADRAARMTPDAALDFLRRKILDLDASIAASKANHDHKRVEAQELRMAGLDRCLQRLCKLIDENDAVLVRVPSGRLCKVSVHGADVSFTSTTAVIGLVPCAVDVKIVERDLSAEVLDGGKVEILKEANLEVVIQK